ncbi:MAG: glycosyltransferase [Candidatus Viridilinea halotolerans]|uniref:Glycosyltransferase n=1 Tax=Candidatus Viridilinea halotolerans TaxID=2491704 RepID=A0A426U2L4_9CHLR|nr:MAG: glycosyltransferase [Candidatus Viridilinea halotolerans]
MHILHIYKDYPPVVGGIEGHLGLLAEGLVARGHQVTVLMSGQGWRTRRTTRAGVRVVAAGRLATLASTPLSPALPLLVAQLRPDLIHLHHPYPPGDAVALLAGGNTPLVVSYHSDIVRQRRLGMLLAPLVRRTLRRAKRIIAASPAYIRSSPFLAPVASRCRVVPYGLPQNAFAPADPARVAAIKARWPAPRTLFVGRLRYYKGADRLVRAMTHVPGHALFVGADATVRASDLAALAAQLGVADRVHLLGDQPDAELAAFYHAADVFVLPSVERSEAFGIVQIEAQAAGLPIVCTELGTGTSYITQHGRTGIVVPPDDVPALARALRVLLANPELAQAMGAAGRVRAHAEFSLERMLDRVEAVYAEAVSA